MFHIERMTEDRKEDILPMVKEFYSGDAVSHPVPMEILEQTFADAVSEDPMLQGMMLMEENRVVGFAYITTYYACEVGGKCMMLEELFLKDETRGKGYGTRFFEMLKEEYPQIKRFRLEVTESNERATKLYKKWGFEFIDYGQMILDKI